MNAAHDALCCPGADGGIEDVVHAGFPPGFAEIAVQRDSGLSEQSPSHLGAERLNRDAFAGQLVIALAGRAVIDSVEDGTDWCHEHRGMQRANLLPGKDVCFSAAAVGLADRHIGWIVLASSRCGTGSKEFRLT